MSCWASLLLLENWNFPFGHVENTAPGLHWGRLFDTILVLKDPTFTTDP